MGQNCTLGARALTLGDLSSAVGLVLGNFLGHQRRCCLPNSTRVDRCRYLRRDSRSLHSKFDFDDVAGLAKRAQGIARVHPEDTAT